MRKYIIITVIVIVSLLIFGIGGYFVFRGKKSTKVAPNQPKTTTKLIKELPLEERPYISLTPSNDGHWVTLEVNGVNDGDEIEYEIIYEKETKDGAILEQGVIGHGTPKGGVYNTGKRLFGTESAGKYSFDKVIDGKTLTIKIRRGNDVFKYETDWRLFNGSKEIMSADGNFSLKGEIAKDNFYIVHETAGVLGLRLTKMIFLDR